MVDNLIMESFGKSLWQAMQEGAEEMAAMGYQDCAGSIINTPLSAFPFAKQEDKISIFKMPNQTFKDFIRAVYTELTELAPLTTYPDLDPGASLYEEPRVFTAGDVWRTRNGGLVILSDVSYNGVIGRFEELSTKFHWSEEGRWIDSVQEDEWDLVEKVEPDFNNLVLVDVEDRKVYHKSCSSKVEEITWTDMAEMSPPGKHVSEIFPWYPASVSLSPRVKHEKALEKQWAEATPEEKALGIAVDNAKNVSLFSYPRYWHG